MVKKMLRCAVTKRVAIFSSRTMTLVASHDKLAVTPQRNTTSRNYDYEAFFMKDLNECLEALEVEWTIIQNSPFFLSIFFLIQKKKCFKTLDFNLS